MATYRVRPGCRFGAYDQHAPGTLVALTAAEAEGFRDKLEPVAEAETADLTPSREDAKAEQPESEQAKPEETVTELRLEDDSGNVGVIVIDSPALPEPEPGLAVTPEPEPTSRPARKRRS